jgi:hypothetical protein
MLIKKQQNLVKIIHELQKKQANTTLIILSKSILQYLENYTFAWHT